MLCEACQDIFSNPRKLSYGTYYPWKQNAATFQVALREGCHLCNLIVENQSYDRDLDEAFLKGMRYAFKALNPNWARYGRGPKWLVPETRDCDYEETGVNHYLNEVERDPTPNGLASLLATDSDKLVTEAANCWLVLEFYGQHAQIVLPMELSTRDEAEELAQMNLDDQTSTGCEENLQLSGTWLQNCLANHPSCGPRQPESWLPTRLIDVGLSDNSAVRLILGSSLDVETQYVALSHRWGTDRGFVLNSGNITRYQEAIPLSDISTTIKDSVVVTRALGLRYLWVDSMCIIQDDSGDWTRESITMSKVYGLSTCTIAAVNSGSSSHGYFTTRNQYRIRQCRVPNPFSTSKDTKYFFNIMSQYLNRIHDREVRGSLWYNRGWVFQERTLSPRLLIFSGTQILWACEQLQAAETWPCGKTNDNYIDQFESFMVEKARFHKLLDPSCGVSINHTTWWTFLKEYMESAELTIRSDRLVAIQGIASLVQGLTGMSYAGGFWLNDNLAGSLLWKATSSNLSPLKEYSAPSWSWAAVEGFVEHEHNALKGSANLIRIIGQKYLQDRPGKSSRNTHEALQVAGKLLHAAIEISPEGDRCEKVLKARYSRSIATRIKIFFQIKWNQWSPFIFRISLLVRKYGLMHISIVIGVMLLIHLIPVVIAIIIALIPIAIVLIPVLFILYGLSMALCFFLKLCWTCWPKIYRSCCFCIIRRAEKKLEKKNREANLEAKLRREAAVARTERFFQDLESGIPLADLQQVVAEEVDSEGTDAKDEITINSSCFLDVYLPAFSMIDVIFLPVVQVRDEISGLILRLVDETVDQYERLGVFEASHEQIKRLVYPLEDEIVLLV